MPISSVYSLVPKWVFRLQGRHATPINVKFGTALVPKCHVYRNYRLRNVGTQLRKTAKICNHAHKFAPQFAQFLRNSQHRSRSTDLTIFYHLLVHIDKRDRS